MKVGIHRWRVGRKEEAGKGSGDESYKTIQPASAKIWQQEDLRASEGVSLFMGGIKPLRNSEKSTVFKNKGGLIRVAHSACLLCTLGVLLLADGRAVNKRIGSVPHINLPHLGP